MNKKQNEQLISDSYRHLKDAIKQDVLDAEKKEKAGELSKNESLFWLPALSEALKVVFRNLCHFGKMSKTGMT